MSEQYSWLVSTVTLQSDKRGFFQEFAENVCDLAGAEWIENFGKLKIDRERVLKCYNDPKIKDLVRETLGNVRSIFRGKCASLSKAKREEAQHFYDLDNFERALLVSNLSVVRAPFPAENLSEDDNLCLPLGLWIRAKSLQKLGKHKQALDDIQMALKNKLPSNLKLEAYERITECFLRLGLRKQAEISLNITINLAVINADAESEERHKTILNEIDSRIATEEVSSEDEIPVLFEGESRAISYLSSSLSMKRTPEKGRHVMANTNIPAGSVLAAEDPYASALRFEKHGTHCLTCFKRIVVVYPCPDCSGVAFCSPECQKSANFHKYECSHLELLLGSGMSVLSQLSLRIITQSNILFFLDFIQAVSENIEHPYLQIYNLETHTKEREPKDFLYRTLMALFLLKILKKSGYFRESESQTEELSETEVTIGCLLLRHLQLTQYNAHEIYETFTTKRDYNLADCKVNYIAVGIYPSSAMFNHACEPTLARYFIGKTIVLRSQRVLNKSDEVTENYGMSCTMQNLETRTKTLKGRYRFECRCTACKEDWPKLDEMDENLIKLRCSRSPCVGKFLYKEGVLDWKCSICGLRNELEPQLNRCRSLKESFDLGFRLMDELKTEEATEVFVKFLNESSTLVAQPNKYLTMAMEALRTCWAYKHNFYSV